MSVWIDSFKKHSGLSSFLVKCVRFGYLDNASVQMQELDDRVVNMYKSVRPILQRYRSGKLPKAFKIIPNLRNWEQVGNLSYLNWKKIIWTRVWKYNLYVERFSKLEIKQNYHIVMLVIKFLVLLMRSVPFTRKLHLFT